ncbi:MAG: L,D-transpeptidase family protein [Deltaproteobacteria bacterium]|nr:L,D-transpeptidase family protein [Deltaproteobacteria bacterium]
MGALIVAILATGCGSKKSEDAPRKRPPPVADPREPVTADAPDVEPPPDFPVGTRSLELTRTVGVRLEAGDTAKRIGTIAIDTRVAWQRTATAQGCQQPWVEIQPRGWVCADYLKPSTKPPLGREVPMLDRGELVPGIYGKVTAPSSVTYVPEKQPPVKPAAKQRGGKAKSARPGPVTSPREVEVAATPAAPKLVEGRPLVGSVNVRQWEELAVGGRVYWRISQKDPEYVLRQAITPHRPSLYGGARLGDDTGWTVPIAFVWPRVAGWRQANTMPKPTGGGVARQLPARTPIQILESATDKAGAIKAYRIGEGEWIWAADVRVYTPMPPPKHVARSERWIDVDLDTQILVAYEGALPVYATLVSSGSKEYPTETGVYRMWLKESEADMKGLNGEDPYSVATVPWTQFYSPEKGLALHTAYWHDQFGVRRSRGCLNMAPRDARWLYFWSDPQVPPGWTMAAGVVEAPGSVVRVRSKADPDPPVRGYAKTVLETRQHNGAVE